MKWYERPHILEPNKSGGVPSRFIFFDTETKEQKLDNKYKVHNLWFGYALYWRFPRPHQLKDERWCYFETPQEFWGFVFRNFDKKSKLVLIAHNIQYDFQVVKGFKYLRRAGFKPNKIILNGTANIWQFRKDTKTILALDNLNYFRVPLKVLGDQVGLEKLQMPQATSPKQEWLIYCKRDVEILYNTWVRWLSFLKENNLGHFGLTLPSQAFNAFRHRFMPEKIFIHKLSTAQELERESYHGGRTECFYIGEYQTEPIYNLDVNSMYPYVMLKNEYPKKLVKVVGNMSLNQLKEWIKTHCVTARVDLSTQDPIFPLLQEGKLIFPIGSFKTTLTTRELKEAVKRDCLKSVEKAVIYEKANLFKGYVEFFWLKRQQYQKEGNHLYQFISKLFLNSLYGKFGQRNDVFEVVGYDPKLQDVVETIFDYDTGERRIRRVIMGRVEESIKKVEAYNSFPAIAAHITADARLYLWQLIEKAGNSNVLYCDTDSLFVTKQGYNRLKSKLSKTKLGFLKLVGKGNGIIIRGLKDYEFANTIKIKGVKKDAIQLDNNSWRQLHFESLQGALRKGISDTQRVYDIVKRYKREYIKGRVTNSGRVLPYVL